MHENYVIVTDSACDLSEEMLGHMEIPFVSLNVFMKDNPAFPCNLRGAAFYQALQSGQVACTSAANLSLFRDTFTKILKQGKDILYLSFSSALSCMCATGRIAAEELMEEFPERKIVVVDSLSASHGQGLLVYYAAQEKAHGMRLEELAAYLEQQRQRTIHWFTVDDLMYLRRGGRVSMASAMAGTLLGIKPVMHMNAEGKLAVCSKVRGRRAAIQTLAKHFHEECEDVNAPVYIGHANALADAEMLRDMIRNESGAKLITIGEIGGVIGAHTGPGALSIFFVGKSRT